MIRLSICIPTYNFGKFIGETLDSILPQMTSEVELIVLDGGSTDDTSDVVRQKFADAPNLIYQRQTQRGGIDRDIEHAIDLARGDYCWLFSADDVMLPGAVQDVLATIHSNSDVYICEHKLCDINLRVLSDHPIFKTPIGPCRFDFSDAVQRKNYFRQAKNSEAFFSFLAGPIFRKSIWDQAPVPESFRGTCWIVAGHLLWGMRNGMSVEYLARCFLLKRGENDSFADRGMVNRFRIAVEGFQHIAYQIFGVGSWETKHIQRTIQSEIPLRILLKTKWDVLLAPELESRDMLDRVARMHYANQGLLGVMKHGVYTMTPAACVPGLLWVKRMLRRVRGRR